MTDEYGMMVVLSAPSGSGKGTVIKALTASDDYSLSVSATTREPRPAETDGKDYFFCSEREFINKRDSGELLEYAEFNGYFYGTPRAYVEETIKKGKVVILEIDVAGALQIKEKYPESVLIFMIPPDKKELERRLTQRKTQTAASIKERLDIADRELNSVGKYDYLVINDTVEEAARKIGAIVTAERLRPARNLQTINNFNKGEI